MNLASSIKRNVWSSFWSKQNATAKNGTYTGMPQGLQIWYSRGNPANLKCERNQKHCHITRCQKHSFLNSWPVNCHCRKLVRRCKGVSLLPFKVTCQHRFAVQIVCLWFASSSVVKNFAFMEAMKQLWRNGLIACDFANTTLTQNLCRSLSEEMMSMHQVFLPGAAPSEKWTKGQVTWQVRFVRRPSDPRIGRSQLHRSKTKPFASTWFLSPHVRASQSLKCSQDWAATLWNQGANLRIRDPFAWA